MNRTINTWSCESMLNLEKLLKKALQEVEKEMDRANFIDDSDNCDRYLDGLARKLVEDELVPLGDMDTYNEKEGEIEELASKLLEVVKDNMKYDSYSKNIKGDCLFCYYRSEEGLEEWLELLREGGQL